MLTGLHHRDEMVEAKSAALFASRMSNERSADELRPRNGAGERSRTVVSALARPHSAVEPHPLEMESRVRVALTCEVLRTTAWAARPTGPPNGECRVWSAEF